MSNESSHHAHHSGASKQVVPEGVALVWVIVAAVIVALVAGFVGYSMGASSGPQVGSIDKATLGSTVEKYINDNLLSASDKAQGLSYLVVADENESLGSLTGYGVYAVQGSQKQQVALVYAGGGKMVIASGKALDLSKPLPAAPEQTQSPAKVAPKSDKPKVELFVMSYCPYGTQMEKAILPVVSALKDKIDFKLEFTHFTLHGEKEDTENFRQMCIREEQGAKFLPYIQCILDSNNVNAPKDQSTCMKSLGIDENAVNSCIQNKAADYYAVDSALSEGYGVQGSPTLVINGTQVDSARSPSGVLSTICSAFNVAPSDCNTVLPSESAAPGFGFNTTNSSEFAAVQCGV